MKPLSGNSRSYPHALDEAGKAGQGQTLVLLQILVNYRCKKFNNTGTGVSIAKLFFLRQ
jgi:hypothetical protein